MELYALNEGALNSGSSTLDTSLVQFPGGVSLGGFPLCGEYSGITAVYHDRKYQNNLFENQFIDGQRIISHLIKEKRITIEFVIKASSNEALQLRIDEFKAKTSGAKTKGVIEFAYYTGGETRILKVITEDMTFNRDGINTTVQSGIITVIAIDPPKAYSYIPYTKIYQSISAGFTGQINNKGNTNAYPVYYIVFNSATSTDEIQLTVNGYTVTINTPISANDVIILSADIYGLQKSAGVYKNNTPIEYTGQVTTPLYSEYHGSNSIEFACNGTYNCDITIIFNPLWE